MIKVKWWAVALLLMFLSGCSSLSASSKTTSNLPQTNPFEQTASSENGIRVGGYSSGMVGIDPLKENTLVYSGKPIQLSYYLQGTGSDTEVGVIIFLDGVVQPHHVSNTNREEDTPKTNQDVVISTHHVSSNGRTEFTVTFTPVTGSLGDELGLNAIFLFEPSFTPQTENQSFGVYQDGRFQIPLTIIMNANAPQQIDNNTVDVNLAPIPQSEKDSSGKVTQPNFLFYSGDNIFSNKSFAKNGQIEMTTSIYGGIDANYRVTVFINNQPVSVANHPNFVISTHYDQISTYKFTLDVHNYSWLNSLYAVIIPTGQSYKDNNIHGEKISSILLVNDTAKKITSSPEIIPIATNLPKVDTPGTDEDLTHLLTDNHFLLKYGEPEIYFIADNRLLVWFDSAGLFDLKSDQMLNKVEVLSGQTRQKIDFVEKTIGVFSQDLNCIMECSPKLERYDSRLNLIDTLDLSQVLDSRPELLEVNDCSLFKSGEELVCAKRPGQLLFYDLKKKKLKMGFDISQVGLQEISNIESLKLVGNDHFLAFIADDGSGFAYGLINLENNKLVDYTRWDAIGDDIQASENAVYFHEQFRGPSYPVSGKIFKIDLNTLKMRTIQLTEKDESEDVAVSDTGKFIVTVRNTAPIGADYTAGSIKIYDGQTMKVIRQIDLEHGYPKVFIDEENRSLLAFYNSTDGSMKLMRYVF